MNYLIRLTPINLLTGTDFTTLQDTERLKLAREGYKPQDAQELSWWLNRGYRPKTKDEKIDAFVVSQANHFFKWDFETGKLDIPLRYKIGKKISQKTGWTIRQKFEGALEANLNISKNEELIRKIFSEDFSKPVPVEILLPRYISKWTKNNIALQEIQAQLYFGDKLKLDLDGKRRGVVRSHMSSYEGSIKQDAEVGAELAIRNSGLGS